MVTREALEKSVKEWWYYTVQLAPDLVAQGTYPADFPYMPRMLMRNAHLQGQDCLDLGSMEGVIPVLMHRKGAKRIIAADAVPHCAEKMDLLQKVYGASWDFREVGLMYDLSQKLAADGTFDYVNLSGVLYHVFSPMHTLASARPLVKKNGLFMLSTNVVNEQSDLMHFNTAGELQTEPNTFWYPSIPLLEYMLRYFNFAPIDCLYSRHPSNSPLHVPGKECGFISIVCRAVDRGAAVAASDHWAKRSMLGSWEYTGLSPQKHDPAEVPSSIGYDIPDALKDMMARNGSIDLHLAVNELGRRVERAKRVEDTYLLRLGDES
ncbi:class I SAM-dependent methyltransferase [Paucibacter sp. DJ1R-11]|uniref:class I SAM-dependent methyltransferase n=1 Tax=Paucibacter sp. DJ1R-11 TaxID=2893556 RepID=UPI0021E442CE|nr:class I SAM-dependent methyltransferase [Paucibacter sp. DJ1R-11]MCV2365909.1 class I SAM-dependent methyltransferase [Paucibacter sp. DJ1R-11]